MDTPQNKKASRMLILKAFILWKHTDSNRGPSACKAIRNASETQYWQYFHVLSLPVYKFGSSNLTCYE